MDKQMQNRARKFFEQAIEIKDLGKQSQFLDEACSDAPELRAKVESLLNANRNVDGILETQDIPVANSSSQESDQDYQLRATTDSIKDYHKSETIGPYKLLQEIGAGGMGQVWMAEQQKPVRRRVALKLIKAGMDTKLVIARFEAERQALALMDHPHIAKIFDAGTTSDGRPFFVMEYVRGKPITKFADDNHLTISERLELFEQVCNAVQHAHHKGIIHRDLKPNNVIVSAPDGKPMSKVIDFGIAKATSQQLTDLTLYTLHDQFIGTPMYMSPEQASGSVDIDTRTDVYSLGVILFELLTGSTPFPSEELRAAGLEQMKKIIIEKEPPKPSTRISLSEQTLDTLAASRRIEPKRLGTLVRGELDWIVMKALDKDRTRRYETPNSFADDVMAYLKGDPIDAAPPSRLYNIQKFVRRYRGQVISASILAAVLFIGMAGTTWGLFRARDAESKTQEALKKVASERDAKTIALKAVTAQKDLAEQHRIAAETNLAQGILRSLGFTYGELSEAELRSLTEWSQITDSNLKLMILEKAFDDPETALRIAWRGERVVQASVGTSPQRYLQALDLLKKKQQQSSLADDAKSAFAACWLTLELNNATPTGMESVVHLVANSSWPATDDDFLQFTKEWVQVVSRNAKAKGASEGKEDVEPILKWLVQMIERSAGEGLIRESIAGLIVLAPHFEPAQTERAWIALIEVLKRADEGIAFDLSIDVQPRPAVAKKIAEGFVALAPKLEDKQLELATASLIQIVKKADHWTSLQAAGVGLTALAPRLSPEQAERAWFSQLEIVALVSGTTNRKIDVELHDPWQEWAPDQVVGNGFAALANRLEPKQITRISTALIEKIGIDYENPLQVAIIQGMQAIAPLLDARQLETNTETLINIVNASNQTSVLQAASVYLDHFAEDIGAADKKRLWVSLTEILAKKTLKDQDTMAEASKCLVALASMQNPKQAGDTFILIMNVFRQSEVAEVGFDTYWSREGEKSLNLNSLASQLDSAQVARVLDYLLDIVVKAESGTPLKSTGDGLAAIIPLLAPPQQDQAWSALVSIIKKTDQAYVAQTAGNGLLDLASKVAPTNLAPAKLKRVLASFIELTDRIDDSESIMNASDGLAALILKLDPAQLALAWDAIIESAEKSESTDALETAGKV